MSSGGRGRHFYWVQYVQFTRNPVGWNFHLLAESPAIDAGETLLEALRDKEEKYRPQGAAYGHWGIE